MIIANSVILALDNPTTTNDFASESDIYFLILYTIEMVLKIFGLGFILEKYSYVRDPWNVLDMAIISKFLLFILLNSYL